MADLYNAPKLRNYYCREMYPLGCEIPKVDMCDLDRISIRALVAFRKVDETKNLLLDITEDGVISEDGREDMQKILDTLSELEAVTQNLKVWVKKNL